MSAPDYFPAVIPSLTVRDCPRAIDFYKAAFGATEYYRLTDKKSGMVGHAELSINGQLVMLADVFPGFNRSPDDLGGTAVKIALMVDDVDAWVARSAAAGAAVTMPPSDQFYGHRSAQVRDPFGHEWMFQHEFEKISPEEMQKRWDEMLSSGASADCEKE